MRSICLSPTSADAHLECRIDRFVGLRVWFFLSPLAFKKGHLALPGLKKGPRKRFLFFETKKRYILGWGIRKKEQEFGQKNSLGPSIQALELHSVPVFILRTSFPPYLCPQIRSPPVPASPPLTLKLTDHRRSPPARKVRLFGANY